MLRTEDRIASMDIFFRINYTFKDLNEHTIIFNSKWLPMELD